MKQPQCSICGALWRLRGVEERRFDRTTKNDEWSVRPLFSCESSHFLTKVAWERCDTEAFEPVDHKFCPLTSAPGVTVRVRGQLYQNLCPVKNKPIQRLSSDTRSAAPESAQTHRLRATLFFYTSGEFRARTHRLRAFGKRLRELCDLGGMGGVQGSFDIFINLALLKGGGIERLSFPE